MFKQDSVLYSKEKDVLGGIAEISYLKGTVTIIDEKEVLHTVSVDNVIELVYLGDMGDDAVFNHDVIGDVDTGKMYEIILQEDGRLLLMLLDKKLEHEAVVDALHKKELPELLEYYALIGSRFEIEPEEGLQFNICIVRENTNGEIVYHYACNNKEEEHIDLVKVVFMGSKLLEEEDYSRQTMSYDAYSALVNEGVLKIVNPQELQNYVTGMTYQPNQEQMELDEYEAMTKDWEDDDEDYEDYEDEEEYDDLDDLDELDLEDDDSEAPEDDSEEEGECGCLLCQLVIKMSEAVLEEEEDTDSDDNKYDSIF